MEEGSGAMLETAERDFCLTVWEKIVTAWQARDFANGKGESGGGSALPWKDDSAQKKRNLFTKLGAKEVC